MQSAQNTAKNSAAAGLPDLPESAIHADVPQGLTFNFSTSTEQGTAAMFNRIHLLGVSRLTSTGLQVWAGGKAKNFFTSAGGILGIWGNLTYFLFGKSKNPTLGNIVIGYGNWQPQGEYFTQKLPSDLSDEAIEQIQGLLKDEAYPVDAIRIDTDKKADTTTLKIRKDAFPIVQREIHNNLLERHNAIAVLRDPNRHIMDLDREGQTVLSGIALDGVADETIRTMKSMIKEEWQMRDRIAGENGVDRRLEVHPTNYMEFTERVNGLNPATDKTLLVKRSGSKSYNPGVVEALLQPHKYPYDHSTLVGGIGGNLARAVSGTVSDKISPVKPKESLSSMMNLMTYIIELQPETPEGRQGNWEETGIARTQIFGGPPERLRQRAIRVSNERPLLIGSALRPASLAIKGSEQWKDYQTALTSYNGNPSDPHNKDAFYAASAKVAATVIDALTAGISATMKKADYGR